MSAVEISVVVAAALIGWFVVSWLFTLGKRRKADPPDSSIPEAPQARQGAKLSDAELARRWHAILGVSEDSALETIEARYREALAECDRIRSSALSSGAEIEASQARRSALTAAYEFIQAAHRARDRR